MKKRNQTAWDVDMNIANIRDPVLPDMPFENVFWSGLRNRRQNNALMRSSQPMSQQQSQYPPATKVVYVSAPQYENIRGRLRGRRIRKRNDTFNEAAWNNTKKFAVASGKGVNWTAQMAKKGYENIKEKAIPTGEKKVQAELAKAYQREIKERGYYTPAAKYIQEEYQASMDREAKQKEAKK